MKAFESALEIVALVWEEYFVLRKSKSQISNDTKLSRMTINKYISIIEDALEFEDITDTQSLNINDIISIIELPTTYKTRKKRVLDQSMKKLIFDEFMNSDEANITAQYRDFKKKYPHAKVSYSSYWRILKQKKET